MDTDKQKPVFDDEAHEKHLAERYAFLARVAAFDRLVDMALDGQISMPEALAQFRTEVECGVEYGT